jgi:hypothetical protein
MSEMVDRVARAMAIKANGGDWNVHYSADQRDLWRLRARAAIEAVRQPTGAMVKAVYEPNIDYPRERCYEVMIDEALR